MNHQLQLWIKICQIVNAHPEREWTPEALAESLTTPVGSIGYQRILEVLRHEEMKQARARQKIKMGFQ
jgi:hypothetical protein